MSTGAVNSEALNRVIQFSTGKMRRCFERHSKKMEEENGQVILVPNSTKLANRH